MIRAYATLAMLGLYAFFVSVVAWILGADWGSKGTASSVVIFAFGVIQVKVAERIRDYRAGLKAKEDAK